MPFLLATFIAYALLPDRNLHMKALMFYVINLMLSYLLLVIIQLTDSRFSQGVCTSIGKYIIFEMFFFKFSFVISYHFKCKLKEVLKYCTSLCIQLLKIKKICFTFTDKCNIFLMIIANLIKNCILFNKRKMYEGYTARVVIIRL
jgi:hypothetical protein